MSDMVKVSSKGQITLPAGLRRRFDIVPGTYLRLIEADSYFRVVVAPKGIRRLQGRVRVTQPQDFKKVRNAVMEDRANARHGRD